MSVERAYKKEYAFLEAQKRELTQRLAATRQQFERERARLDGEIAGTTAILKDLGIAQ